MKPPDANKSGAEAGAGPPEPLGAVEVGPYVLRVGDPAGTVVQQAGGTAGDDVESLARALEEPRQAVERESVSAAAGELVDEASAVTAKVERAAVLGEGVAAGNVLDPDQLALEVGTLLSLLERLDRQGRSKEALRLARTLTNLFTLLRRWMELLRALRAALRAAEKLGDLKAVAWAKHELGTLQVAAEDVAGAERSLGEAREIRERLGDRRGLAATNRNLQVLCERLRQMLREKELVRAASRRPPFPGRLALTAILVLLFAGGVVTGVVASGSDDTADVPARADPPAGVTDTTPPNTNTPTGEPTPGSGFTLSITTAGDGAGTVRSDPEGIDCGGDCEEEFPVGEEVVLVPEPASGSIFQEFSEPCAGAPLCTLTMTGAQSVTATFVPIIDKRKLEDEIEDEGEEENEGEDEEEGLEPSAPESDTEVE